LAHHQSIPSNHDAILCHAAFIGNINLTALSLTSGWGVCPCRSYKLVFVFVRSGRGGIPNSMLMIAKIWMGRCPRILERVSCFKLDPAGVLLPDVNEFRKGTTGELLPDVKIS
jgi:hypothetical protein